jgi:hypothetical protein
MAECGSGTTELSGSALRKNNCIRLLVVRQKRSHQPKFRPAMIPYARRPTEQKQIAAVAAFPEAPSRTLRPWAHVARNWASPEIHRKPMALRASQDDSEFANPIKPTVVVNCDPCDCARLQVLTHVSRRNQCTNMIAFFRLSFLSA